MTLILRRALAFAAAVFFGLGVMAAPAQASTVFNCEDGRICLYDGTGYGMYSTWRNSLSAVHNSNDGAANCVNLTNDPGGLQWGYMNNAASSLIVNPYPETQAWVVGFHMNLNCQGTPTLKHHTSGGLYLDSDLRNGAPSNYSSGNVTSNISNAITSISVRFG